MKIEIKQKLIKQNEVYLGPSDTQQAAHKSFNLPYAYNFLLKGQITCTTNAFLETVW